MKKFENYWPRPRWKTSRWDYHLPLQSWKVPHLGRHMLRHVRHRQSHHLSSRSRIRCEGAEERKKSKYASLTDRYIFQPIAIETAGVFGPSTLTFLKSLGSRIATERGNPREAEYLIQRLSLAVIRGNAQAVLTSSKC